MPNGLINRTDAAKMLGVHPRTVYRWTKKGLINHTVTPGNKFFYDPKDIERMLKEMERKV